jgi:hypothetical protein
LWHEVSAGILKSVPKYITALPPYYALIIPSLPPYYTLISGLWHGVSAGILQPVPKCITYILYLFMWPF